MILKVKKSDFEWVFFENIRRINKRILDDFCLTYDGFNDVGYPSLCVCSIYNSKNKNEGKVVNRSSRLYYNEFLFDEKIFLDQIDQTEKVEDSKSKNIFWCCSEIVLNYNNNDVYTIITLPNTEMYLLNNDGKTIEKL